MRFPILAILAVAAAGTLAVAAEDYQGPMPPKPDVPYLVHASKLVEPEITTARETDEKKMHVATVAGAASPVRTPLPEPIFLFLSKNVLPGRLQMYKMEVRGGERRLEIPNEVKKKSEGPRPVILMANKVGPNLYRVEVNENIEDGQYCISPSGASDVYCFEVY